MRSLNASQPHPHFVAILQLTLRDALLQSGKSFFDLGHKAAADSFLFLLPPLRTAEDIGLFPTQNLDLLDLYIRTDLLEIVLQQLGLELLELAACRAHQILSTTLADGRQVFLAPPPAIEDRSPPSFPMLALHCAQNRFDGGHIGAVPIEQFIAEGKTVWIHDQRQHQLFAVGTMIPRIASPHPRVLLC